MLLAWLPPTQAFRPRPHRVLTSLALIVVTLFGPACHDATGPNDSLVPVPSFTIVSGNAQTGVAGSELALPIVAKATNSSGTALAGVTVFFVVTQGGGKLYAGGGVTDASGNVQDYWTLGPGVGAQKVEVRAVDPTSGAKNSYATFTATSTAGPAKIIKVSAGDGQTAFTRAPLAIKPAVLVTDALGNPVAGVSVTFAVTAGGGSIGSAPVVTDANGVGLLVSNWRLGRAPGVNKITATKSGLTGSPVTFTATARFGLKLVALGVFHTCGLSAANDVYCWGWNDYGAVGDNTTITRSAPVKLANTALLPPQLALAWHHSCMLLSTGKAQCWGYGGLGELGNGANASSNTPVPVSGSQVFTRIEGAGDATCGIEASGAVWCWGSNSNGEFGNGTNTNSNAPILSGGGIPFKAIYRGFNHTCGLTATGTAWCWGYNAYGQVGDASTTPRNSPVLVSGGLTFVSLDLGEMHSCGLTAAGKAYCWGQGTRGQLGNWTTANASAPTAVAGDIAFTQLGVGAYHTCGLTAAGVAYCWGQNTYGSVGNGVIGDPVLSPTLVGGSRTFSAIQADASYHTCGIPVGGGLPFCWGENQLGQAGNGSFLDTPLPLEVRTPSIP